MTLVFWRGRNVNLVTGSALPLHKVSPTTWCTAGVTRGVESNAAYPMINVAVFCSALHICMNQKWHIFRMYSDTLYQRMFCLYHFRRFPHDHCAECNTHTVKSKETKSYMNTRNSKAARWVLCVDIFCCNHIARRFP